MNLFEPDDERLACIQEEHDEGLSLSTADVTWLLAYAQTVRDELRQTRDDFARHEARCREQVAKLKVELSYALSAQSDTYGQLLAARSREGYR